MKSEAEIRKHRVALAIVRLIPCSCAATGHDMECQIGGTNMAAAELVLSWVLGEAPERYDETVALVNSVAARHHPQRN